MTANKPARRDWQRDEGWEWYGIYGTRRTAENVAFGLRQRGWETRIETDAHDNHTVYRRRA